MNARRLQPLALLTALALALPALAAPAASGASTKAPLKPLTTLINGVRYGKDALALQQFDGEAQGRFLFGDDWAKGTEAQRKEFARLFHGVLAKIAFPELREKFKHLQAVQYEDPKVDGERATVGSTILILHPLKKQEMKVKYTVHKSGAAWKVVDVSTLGDSMLTGLRDEQVRPLLKEGGWEAVMKALRSEAQKQGVATK
ncbi:MAG TPA: ABC transporter substrate-binding protein [Aggregicoccus sp.]|nr:ABC transporter substrate-binding protein [Aggregicoccus sp.]